MGKRWFDRRVVGRFVPDLVFARSRERRDRKEENRDGVQNAVRRVTAVLPARCAAHVQPERPRGVQPRFAQIPSNLCHFP